MRWYDDSIIQIIELLSVRKILANNIKVTVQTTIHNSYLTPELQGICCLLFQSIENESIGDTVSRCDRYCCSQCTYARNALTAIVNWRTNDFGTAILLTPWNFTLRKNYYRYIHLLVEMMCYKQFMFESISSWNDCLLCRVISYQN